tara:strand:- start:1658 stop:1972 length:315 start_codon:yes stop_codon:yes gene_type:complete
VTPTSRTLTKLRTDGWIPEVTERYIPGANIRKDLYGWIDVLGIKESGEVLAVQCTSKSNMSSRIRKIEDSDTLPIVRKCGWKIEVWGWFKSKAGKWEVKIEDIS